ncbi:hypothetical protein VN97_g10559, partial [Penicillium thymicola]
FLFFSFFFFFSFRTESGV